MITRNGILVIIVKDGNINYITFDSERQAKDYVNKSKLTQFSFSVFTRIAHDMGITR